MKLELGLRMYNDESETFMYRTTTNARSLYSFCCILLTVEALRMTISSF